ncbi:MAG TPA: aminoglycoside 6'-N-acetyltransferase [Thermoanaerobaculia bacterium]|nr:aminoglycoside 6'-N-acetyltransferase [Thermoanaerobaculia bacterium]
MTSIRRSQESDWPADSTSLLFRTRFARLEDAAAWGRLRHALWPDEAGEHEEEIASFFAGDRRFMAAVIVAVDARGEVVGFAELSLRKYAEGCSSSPVGFLEGWYVVPEMRRQGVGGALVRAAEAWAREQGCTEFASDTEVENTLSAAAHNALGFEDVGIIRCFRKDLQP